MATTVVARGCVSLLFITLVSAQGWVSAINDSSASVWDQSQARVEVTGDVARFLSECQMHKHHRLVDNYAATRDKGIKEVAQHVASLAELLQLPLSSVQLDLLYAQMLELAVAMNATFVTTVPQAENVTMRGWPMMIKSAVPEFESYQAGHIAEAIALAAEQAALRGEHGTAASLAHSVAAMLHDGFLTTDLSRTKVAAPGVVVYVPAAAPEGRRSRYAAMHKTWSCLDQPQALNHGLLSAAAAIALLRACAAIDWSLADWHLEDADGTPLDRETYLGDLEEYVAASTRYLLDSLNVRETDSTNATDAYPGPNGTKWYIWKYRDVSGCLEGNAARGGREDRWEDISHAYHELKFVANVRALGGDYFGKKGHFGVTEQHLRRFIVTVLNRLIVDRTVSGGNRFACDVSGNTTDEKSCGSSREEKKRHYHALWLLVAAIAARDDPGAKCDVLSLVDGVLPLFIDGHPDFSAHGKKCGNLVALQAKYYFYWYEAGQADCLVGGAEGASPLPSVLTLGVAEGASPLLSVLRPALVILTLGVIVTASRSHAFSCVGRFGRPPPLSN